MKELSAMGIHDAGVLDALMQVARHLFFPPDFADKAYENIAFPIEGGQTISQPFTVAFQTQLLQIKSGDRVLEIGTGSGYQAAILEAMGAKVYSIETVQELYQNTKERFKILGLDIHCFYGDGSKGLLLEAPFDKILLTAAAPAISKSLAAQLKTGGLLVAPVGSRDVQKMVRIKRLGENEYRKSSHGNFTFVPLTGTHGWKL